MLLRPNYVVFWFTLKPKVYELIIAVIDLNDIRDTAPDPALRSSMLAWAERRCCCCLLLLERAAWIQSDRVGHLWGIREQGALRKFAEKSMSIAIQVNFWNSRKKRRFVQLLNYEIVSEKKYADTFVIINYWRCKLYLVGGARADIRRNTVST